MARGASWFRELGTDASPGTVVITVSGATRHAGVAEVPMGMPLREAIERIGGGAREGRHVIAAMSGVANAVLAEDRLGTPLSYEGMEAAGAGLGAGGFLVFDDQTDMVAVAAAASRFLAVESCGQCTPCKQDGLTIAGVLERARRSEAQPRDLEVLEACLATVADSARCSLATQHQRLVGSIVASFAEALRAHVGGGAAPAPEYGLAPIVELEDGAVVLDEHERAKQPDWTYGDTDSGAAPAERLATSRAAGERTDPRDLADLEPS
jgi:NADH-quinone oxidoreductase subunit F